MIFTCKGHSNILGTHKTTIEFTKDNYLTKKGNCIIGINAIFDYDKLISFVKKNDKAKIIIEVDNLKEEIIGRINKKFNHSKEIVLRLGSFTSTRTLLINCNKAAKHLNRDLISKLKKGKKMKVILKGIKK